MKENLTVILNSKTYQWGGAAFMVASLLFLVNKLNEMSRLFLSRWMPDVIDGQNTLLILLGQLAFIFGYVAFWQLYAPRAGRWARIAMRLFCSGGILVAVGHTSFISALPNFAENLFALVLLGMLLLVSGLIWLGILNLRQPVMGHWRWLPLLTGLMGFVGFFLFSGEVMTAVFLLFRTSFALGLLGLGLTMWLDNKMQVEIAH